MNLTLFVWRQKSPDETGGLEQFEVSDIDSEMSFLEMLDVVNEGLIKKGVDEGSFVEVDPELTSHMIVSTAMGLLLQSLLDPKGAKWENVARESTTMLVNGLLKK